MMPMPSPIENMTMICEKQFGSRWRKSTVGAPPPIDWIASTNSRSRIAMTCARTTRATAAQPTMPRARISDSKLGPTAATTAISNSSAGYARVTSATRITALSMRPPKYPATNPSSVPMSKDIKRDAMLTCMEMRAP